MDVELARLLCLPLRGRALFALLAVSALASAAGVKYRVGVNTGINCDPYRISDNGFMALDKFPNAYAWDPVFGLFQIPRLDPDEAIEVNDINIHGVATGWAQYDIGGGWIREVVFRWDRQSGTQIALDFGYRAMARSINDLGMIAGFYDNQGLRGFVSNGGTAWSEMQPMYPGGATAVNFVNNSGLAAGYAMPFPGEGLDQPVVWMPNGALIDMGWVHPLQDQTFVNGLNERGNVCGGSYGDLGDIAFIWRRGSGYEPIWNPYDPGAYIAAHGINDYDDITGSLYVPGVGLRGFVKKNGQPIQVLNDVLHSSASGWNVDWSYDINNKGQIACVGWFNGQRRGIMLQPVKDKAVISIGRS